MRSWSGLLTRMAALGSVPSRRRPGRPLKLWLVGWWHLFQVKDFETLLELVAVLVALLAFGDNPRWANGRRAITLTGITDNAGNSHDLRKYGTSKYPLSIIVMEVACQLDRLQLELELGWVPRAQNTEADDLTNERFVEFDEAKRIQMDFENLPFMVMGDLLKKAGELDAELKLHKTSKEAKKSALESSGKEAPLKKRKKGEMRWKDPW